MTKEKKSFLPDNKILFFVFSMVIISIFIFIFFSKKDKNSIDDKDYRQITLKAIKGIGSNAEDSDGDGISDYEEEMDGTDKNNPDTDGDGVSDFIEKKLGTDPKVKKEKDPVVKNKLKELNKKKKNTTERIETELMRKIFEFRGRDLEKGEYEKMLKNIYHRNLPRRTFKIKYSEKDIASSRDITIKQYKNSFITAGTYIDETLIDEKLILAEYLARPTKISKGLTQLSIDNLRLFEKKVSEMKVPEVAKKNHLKYLNSLSVYLDVIQNIIDTYEDDTILSFMYYQELDVSFMTFAKNVAALNKLYFR